jgi:hypothetical protein
MSSKKKNEYVIFKPTDITRRRGLSRKDKNRVDELIQDIMHIYMQMSQ